MSPDSVSADPPDIPLDPSTLVRFGTIASVDLATARCTVRYGNPDDEDGGATTPPIRWLHSRSGQTKSWSPPSVGEEVLLLTPGGQLGLAVALGGLSNDNHPPSGSTAADRLEYADGAVLSYDPETHALTATLPAGATALIEAPGGLTIRGGVTIEGKLTVTEDVTADGVSLKNHTHGATQAGAGNTGPPD